MNRRIITFLLVVTMLTTLLSTGLGFATNTSELEAKREKIAQEEKEIAQKIKEGEVKEKELKSQFDSIKGKIASVEGDINNLQDDIKQTQDNIAKVYEELQKVEDEMDGQSENLNKRLRAMYMKDNASFLEILMGSESIVEFMSNMDIIQLIYESDLDLLEIIEENHIKTETQMNNLEKLENQLEQSKSEEAAKKTALVSDRNEMDTFIEQVEADNYAHAKAHEALAVEADLITSQILALQNPNVQYTGGSLGWPLPGSPSSYRITSEFGNRAHPITGKPNGHLGMDIAASTGVSVLAANSGTVIKAEYNRSYGYMVIIDHGGGIATLYAHNSRLGVKVGQQVAKGETISYVGSTGESTGPHLHFEVRENGAYTNPRNWLGI